MAGGIDPAAVIIMGKIFSRWSAAMITALYPARVAWEDNESMLWARVIRGMNSMAKTVILRAARVFTTSGLAKGAM